MKDTKIQWHPGFVAAINLELAQNRDDLVFEKEYNLNTKPLEIDLLVVKKNPSVQVANEIGRLFRGHNIMEYKSPGDHLDIDAFYKAGAYASLYKAYGETVDEIKADDVTVSILREAKPEGLFRYFADHGYRVSNPYRGIYYIEEKVLFPTQVIVTGELKPEGHIWLKALSEKLKREDFENLLHGIGGLTGKLDRELADSVLEVSIGANQRVMEELRGDERMCQALLELMEPVMQRREQEIFEKGIQKGIQVSIDMLRELGRGEAEIKDTVMRKYGISAEEVEGYL